MGRAFLIRLSIAAAVFSSAAAMRAQCVSQMREASSGVFNRLATSAAWSGTNLGVAKVDESNSRAISFAVYSEDLTPLTSDQTIAPASFVGVNALLWNGSDFALFYENAEQKQLVLQRISASGDPLGGPVPIAANHLPATEREYDIVWDPSRQAYIVATTVYTGLDKGLWIVIVNRDGSVRSEQVITLFLTAAASPRVAVNASGLIAVIFKRSGAYSVQTVDATGTTGIIRGVMPANDARIASNGADFVVVGSGPAGATSKEIDWATVSASGAVSATSKLLTARGAELAPVALLWNATRSEWALSYLDSLLGFSQLAGDYRLHRFTDSGATISDSTFSPDPLQTRLSTRSSFAWTGTSYVTAASRAATNGVTPVSFIIRNCPLTATINALQYVRASAPVSFTAAIDGAVGDASYSWQFSDNGESRTGSSVTHQYTHTGDYIVTLRVTDSTGATSTTSMVVHVITPKHRSTHH